MKCLDKIYKWVQSIVKKPITNEEILLQAAMKAAKESTYREYPFTCPLCKRFTGTFAKGGKGRLSAGCSSCNVQVTHIPSDEGAEW